MTPIQSTTLYYRDGGSDKVYQIQITHVPDKDLYSVDAFYGRRGQTLQHAPKTSAGPVELDAAKKIFDKEVKGKMAKGYTPDESGEVYVATSNEDRVTGLVPQLLNKIPEEMVEKLICDDDYLMQEKKDGVRIMGRVEETHTQKTTLSNRKGLSVSAASIVLREIAEFPTGTITDGELIAETYWLFDILQWGNEDYRKKGYQERYRLFHNIEAGYNDKISVSQRPMRVVPTAFTTEEKRALYAKLVEDNAEGVVFKKKNAPYVPGRPASGGNQLKFKFYSTTTCLVQAINDKRSVSISVLGGNGTVSVGNVTVPPNQNIPTQGSLIEVRYLYAYRGGSLFQPTLIRERNDLHSADHMDTLKYKSTDTDEDEE